MKKQASNSLAFLSSYHEGNLTNPEEKHEVRRLSCANESQGQPENPVSADTQPLVPRVAQYDLNSQERESAISRYKEKRKTRRYRSALSLFKMKSQICFSRINEAYDAC